MPVERDLFLTETGNEKLGGVKARVLSFSLPRGLPSEGGTCVGASAVCRMNCYAKRLFSMYPCYASRAYENFDYVLKHGTLPPIEESPKDVDFLRMHVSGDFFSNEYLQACIDYFKRPEHSKFPVLAYTRAWNPHRKFEQIDRKLLMEFARLPNVTLWLSCDENTGMPPAWMAKKTPAGFMAVSDKIPASFNSKLIRLVFRAHHPTPFVTSRFRKAHPTKRLGKVVVCPPQQGFKELEDLSCLDCKFCFTKSMFFEGKHSFGKLGGFDDTDNLESKCSVGFGWTVQHEV